MAGKPGSWAKGQKIVKTVDLSDGTTAEGVVIVDTDGNVAGGTGGGPATIANGADVAQGNTSDTAWDGVSATATVVSILKKIASGGGSAVSVADGADVAQGTTTDAASSNTVIGLLKNIKAALAGVLQVSQSGTWTVQPGNTANTTAWKVDGSAVVQPVSGTVTANTGDLTDTQLRASPVPVSGPLTDTQLRNSAVPVSLASTTVTGSVAVTGPLTDTQLRASNVPVSLSSTTITGTVTTTDATIAADAATTEPSVGLIGGWDGLAVRSATMTVLDGENMMSVRDPISRRLLEEILLELRVLNENIASSLPTQKRYDSPVIAGLEFK